MRVKRIGTVGYDELDDETKDDVVFSIKEITKENEDDIRAGLANGPAALPLVSVNPSLLYLRSWSVKLTDDVVKAYADYWKDGDEFPPIVIDSSRRPPVLEGRHRTTSAVKAKVKTIKAIDLAGIRVVKKSGFETYGF